MSCAPATLDLHLKSVAGWYSAAEVALMRENARIAA